MSEDEEEMKRDELAEKHYPDDSMNDRSDMREACIVGWNLCEKEMNQIAWANDELQMQYKELLADAKKVNDEADRWFNRCEELKSRVQKLEGAHLLMSEAISWGDVDLRFKYLDWSNAVIRGDVTLEQAREALKVEREKALGPSQNK